MTEPAGPRPGKAIDRSVPFGGARTACRGVIGVIAVLIGVGALFCAFYVAHEQGIYFWDFAWYENQTVAVTHAFQTSIATGVYFIARTLGEDYNDLFTLPLVPWIAVFGAHRVVFILALYFTFFVPYLAGIAVIAARIFPARPGQAATVAAVATLATPACWYHVVQGYPDVVGAALMTMCVLLYGAQGSRSRPGVWVGIGLLAGLSVMLRRHYLYAVMALYAALLADVVYDALANDTLESQARRWWPPLTWLGVSAASAVAFITMLDPKFFPTILISQSKIGPWRVPLSETAIATLGTIGAIPLALAAAGWVVMWADGGRRRPELRVTTFAAIAWVALWIGHARQAPYHYPHWLPLFVVLGLTAFWLRLDRLAQPWVRRPLQAVTVGLAAIAWTACVPVFENSLLAAIPPRLLPDTMDSAENPAYASIVDLVAYLRQVAKPGDSILVAASSRTLNLDTLSSAEIAVYGRPNARLRILNAPWADTTSDLPTQPLLDAAFVVVGEPFQHHLQPQYQKVVRVLLDAFREEWPVTRDFELLPRRFALPEPGGEMRVYRRVRPSSPEAAFDASRRIDRFVLGRDSREPIWTVHSPIPSTVVRRSDGSYVIQAHPTRASDHDRTRVELIGVTASHVEVSGRVWFTDPRCVGVEILALSDGAAAPGLSTSGLFTPARDGAPLRATLPSSAGSLAGFEVRSSPIHPEDIDNCTVVLKDLMVR